MPRASRLSAHLVILAAICTSAAVAAPPVCVSPITLREEKGLPLTRAETDANYTQVRLLCAADILDFTNPCSNGQVIEAQDGVSVCSTSGAGSVTSVALSVPTFLAVSGSPITTSGTLAVTASAQTANTVLAGPTSGGAATPAFRALVAGDVPALPYLANSTTYAGSSSQGGAATTAAALAANGANCDAGSYARGVDASGAAEGCTAVGGGGGVSDHGDLTGLGDDDHAQYSLLAGRSSGQTLIGGTGASEELTLRGTSSGTTGPVRLLHKAIVSSTTEGAVILQLDADSFGSQAGYLRIGKGDDSYGGLEWHNGEVRQCYGLLFPDENVYFACDGAQRFIFSAPVDVDRLRYVPRSSAPVSCGSTTRGTIYYDSDDGDFCDCVGTGWRSRGGAGACS